MNTPSRLASGILAVFGLPFLGMGLFAATTFLRAANQPQGDRIAAAAFASAFAIVGAGVIFGAVYGYARQREQSERQAANPTSPWLWRVDWAASRVDGRNKSSAIGWWVAAVLVNMMLLPLSYATLPKLLGPGLIGLLVLACAIRATIRLQRFGKSYFEMKSLPFSPGSHVAGAIHVHLNSDAAHGIALSLSCFRRLVTGSGNNRSTQQVRLWEDSKNVPATSLIPGPVDTIVPVDFAIGSDTFQTDHDNSSDRVLWLLTAKADVPGVDYSDEFEIPVYRTSPSPASTPWNAWVLATAAHGEVEPSRSGDSTAEVAEPAQHSAIVSDTADGREFYFRPARNVRPAVLALVVAASCTGLLSWLPHIRPTPPLFALIIVGLMDFLLIAAAVHAVLSTSRIVAGNGTVSWRRSVLGVGRTQRVQASDIDSILALTSMQPIGSSGNNLYSIRLRTKAGKTHTLADDIESRQEVRWIVAQMQRRADLRLDSHVEISTTLYGPPPQPGAVAQSGSGSQPPGRFRTASQRSNLVATAIGALIFLAWLAFLGHTIWRNATMRGRHGSRSAAVYGVRAGAPNASANFMRTPAMKQASLGEVLTWPAQKQAEEIMARCKEHDAGALHALEQNVENWTGQIRLTDNLSQLEDRSRFSNDLRVRRAAADLELALDGWPRFPRSVVLLIERAQSGTSYRLRALYFLGVLAGDGVESERAHQFILDDAYNSHDPAVRQWATEGLRFIGSDQALGELFHIFTHDASFSVRDRAGCNISDCGIFERRQRLRLVPRLIELAADPNVNAQMRSWSFLALREITDENLPPDVAAWRRWYQNDGALKRTQFEALDWWQVRGDG